MIRVLFRTGVLAVAIFAAASFGAPVRAQAPSEVEAAAAEAISNLDLQTDMRASDQIKSAVAEANRQHDIQTEMPTAPEEPQGWKLPQFDLHIPTGLLLWFLYGALLVGAVLLIIVLAGEIPIFGAAGKKQWDKNNGAVGPRAPASIEEAEITADEFARQGHYVEAMHVLLLRAVTEIRQRLGEHFADSMTSREILRRARISDASRTSLRNIITSVEWSYFGAHPAQLSDYTTCRENFDRLVHGLQSDSRA